MTDLFNGRVWWSSGSTSIGYWTIQYESRRSDSAMQYRFHWKVWLNQNYWYDYALQIRLLINGTSYDITVKDATWSETRGWSYEKDTGWYTVSNKTSGTTSFSAQLRNSSKNSLEDTSDSYSLYVSPWQATITNVANFTDRINPVFNFSNPGGYVVKPYLIFLNSDGTNGLTLNKYDGDSISNGHTWSLSTSEKTQIQTFLGSRFSCQVKIGIRTTINGTDYWDSKIATFTIADSNSTIQSVNVIDTNSQVIDFTRDSSKLIKYKSNASITVNCQIDPNTSFSRIIINGTTIKSYTQTASGIQITHTIYGIDTDSLDIELYDSRTIVSGVCYQHTENLSMNDYIPLTLSANFNRTSPTTDNEVVLSYSGKCFSGQLVSSDNNLTLQWEYRIKGESNWTNGGDIHPTLSNNRYSGEINLGANFNYENSYEFRITYYDRLESFTTSTFSLSMGTPVFDWGKNDFNFNVPLYYKGVPMDFVIEQGPGSMGFSNDEFVWTYRKWYSGIAECWGTYTTTVSDSSTSGNIWSCTLTHSSVAYPWGLFHSAPSVTAEANGGSGWLVCIENGDEYYTPTYRLMRTYQGSNDSITIHISARGRWCEED